MTPALRVRAAKRSMQTDRDVASTHPDGVPEAASAALASAPMPAARAAAASLGSMNALASLEYLKAQAPPSAEVINASEIPGGGNTISQGLFPQVTEHFPDFPPANDPIWDSFGGSNDLMALFPDLPSLVSCDGFDVVLLTT